MTLTLGNIQVKEIAVQNRLDQPCNDCDQVIVALSSITVNLQ